MNFRYLQKKYKNIFITTVLVCFNWILLLKLSYKNVSSEQSNILVSKLYEILKESYKINGRNIPQDIEVFNLLGTKFNLRDRIENKQTLLLVYSEISCNSCLDSLIIKCNGLIDSSNKFNILGIAYSNDINYLRVFSRINNIKFPIFWDKENKLINKLNIKLLPALFFIDDKGKIVNSYFMDSEVENYSRLFFPSIKQENNRLSIK